MQIIIQVPCVTLERMQEICEHFDLNCIKRKGDSFTVEGTDGICFFWLGANLPNILNPIETGITTTKCV